MHEYWNKQMDLSHTRAAQLLERVGEPWQALCMIHDYILDLQRELSERKDFIWYEPGVLVHKSVKIADFATIKPPVIIDESTEVRPGAFIRGNALIGKHCVVGNSTELKNVILFDRVQVPHYNYVGDSILGYRAHMGAGSITSNVKSDKTEVVLYPERTHTGLKKMGAILCDRVEVGCNSVLNPGTIVLRETNIYPLSSVRGRVPSNSIYKAKDDIVKKNN